MNFMEFPAKSSKIGRFAAKTGGFFVVLGRTGAYGLNVLRSFLCVTGWPRLCPRKFADRPVAAPLQTAHSRPIPSQAALSRPAHSQAAHSQPALSRPVPSQPAHSRPAHSRACRTARRCVSSIPMTTGPSWIMTACSAGRKASICGRFRDIATKSPPCPKIRQLFRCA